jgi:hypothetical protein
MADFFKTPAPPGVVVLRAEHLFGRRRTCRPAMLTCAWRRADDGALVARWETCTAEASATCEPPRFAAAG